MQMLLQWAASGLDGFSAEMGATQDKTAKGEQIAEISKDKVWEFEEDRVNATELVGRAQ